MSANDFENIKLSKLPDILIVFILMGTWLLSFGSIILLLDVMGIPSSIVLTDIPIAFLIGFVGSLLWFSLLHLSILAIKRFHKELEFLFVAKER